ncbi:terpene synthase family protein [Nocardia thraciensis]
MSASVDLVAWINDIYSIEKELALGDFHSAVLIIQRKHGCTLQQAAEEFAPRISARADQFTSLRGDLEHLLENHRADPATREGIRRCVLGLELWATGHRDWTMIAQRYGVCDQKLDALSRPARL